MDISVYPKRSLRGARLLALADYIESAAAPFDMTTWDCCVAGQCARMNGERYNDDVATFAREWLQLSCAEAHMLFAPSSEALCGLPPHGDNLMIDHITRAWASATLRHLAVTGRIDWMKSRPQPTARRWVVMLTDGLDAPRPLPGDPVYAVVSRASEPA